MRREQSTIRPFGWKDKVGYMFGNIANDEYDWRTHRPSFYRHAWNEKYYVHKRRAASYEC